MFIRRAAACIDRRAESREIVRAAPRLAPGAYASASAASVQPSSAWLRREREEKPAGSGRVPLRRRARMRAEHSRGGRPRGGWPSRRRIEAFHERVRRGTGQRRRRLQVRYGRWRGCSRARRRVVGEAVAPAARIWWSNSQPFVGDDRDVEAEEKLDGYGRGASAGKPSRRDRGCAPLATGPPARRRGTSSPPGRGQRRLVVVKIADADHRTIRAVATCRSDVSVSRRGERRPAAGVPRPGLCERLQPRRRRGEIRPLAPREAQADRARFPRRPPEVRHLPPRLTTNAAFFRAGTPARAVARG